MLLLLSQKRLRLGYSLRVNQSKLLIFSALRLLGRFGSLFERTRENTSPPPLRISDLGQAILRWRVAKIRGMSRIWILVVAGLVLGAAGAETYRRMHERPVPMVTPIRVGAKIQPVDPVADADVQAVLDELAVMKPGISISTWKQGHPEDQRSEEVPEDACAAFHSSKPLADGHTLSRVATFYPPDPPKPLALPAADDAESLINRCTLASLRVELEVDGREKLLRSLPGIQEAFTKQMGNPDPQLAAYSYPLGAPWHLGDGAVIIEKNPDISPLLSSVSNTLRKQLQPKAVLVTYSYLPKGVDSKERDSEQHQVVSPESSPEIFELAVRTAGIEQADLVNAMNRLYRDSYEHPRLSGDIATYQEMRTTPGLERGKEVVETLEAWLRVTRELPPQRRAGGLLAAYFLLKVATDHLDNGEMEAMRDWLLDKKVLEAQKQLTPWGGATAKWAKEAQELDPRGPIGDAVTLMAITNPQAMNELMPRGYQPGAEWQGNKDVTDFVIETGEKFLARTHDAETAERVEYFIGLAYSDRIQLARFGARDKPSRWEVERATAAQPEAIKYFMMAAASDSPCAVTAWRSGWRVLAGLPMELRFYELGD